MPGSVTIPLANGSAAATGSDLPKDIAQVAADFVAAWASHDARPHHDKAFTDAGKRAAKYTSADLGASLSTPRPGTTAQWATWTKNKTTLVATITKVSVPDGAPGPTRTSALARVLYRLTQTPARGKTTRSTRQVALQLEKHDGRWRVIALPYA